MLVRRVALLRNVPRAVVGRVGIPPPLLRALVPSVRVSTSAVQSPLLVLILVLVLNGRGRQTTPATQCAAALCPLERALVERGVREREEEGVEEPEPRGVPISQS